MAITITKLKMWKNPGYTKGCVEVPPAGSKKLPAPDYTSTTNLRPRKNATITAIELPMSFCQVFDMSYLYMEFEDNAHNQCKVFGWIDSIEQTASGEESVLIRWSPDFWRTYSGDVTWGYGTITKCNDATYRRPSPTLPRMWKVKHSEKLLKLTDTAHTNFPYCVVVSYNEVDGQNNITKINYLYWLASLTGSESFTDNGVTYHGMTLNQVFMGLIDDILQIKPENINGIFITPVEPFPRQPGLSYIHHNYLGTEYFAYEVPTLVNIPQFSSTFTNTYASDDNLKTVVIDPNGAIVYTLPWGYSVKSVEMGIDTGTVSANIKFILKSGSESIVESVTSGRAGSIPAIPLPYNSNAISSYLYSGQRDYDIEMRNIQRDQQTISGLQNITSSMFGGIIAGSMTGRGHAVGGAVAGATMGIVNTAVDYTTAGLFNDRLQEATDKLISNQASNIIQAGGGTGFLNSYISPKDWMIVQLESDSVSQTEYANQIARNGYDTDLSTSVSTYIASSGALQIKNLNMTGAIPPQAKQYIKNILENGIFIVENNPSGVVP